MRVIVTVKPGKRGYAVYNPKGVKIATVERLNLINAYRTKLRGKAALCGEYTSYSEDCEASYKLDSVDNLAMDMVVMTPYGSFCQPTGTIMERK